MWHPRGAYPRYVPHGVYTAHLAREELAHGDSRRGGHLMISPPLQMQAQRQGWVSRPVSKGMHALHKSEMGAVTGFGHLRGAAPRRLRACQPNRVAILVAIGSRGAQAGHPSGVVEPAPVLHPGELCNVKKDQTLTPWHAHRPTSGRLPVHVG
jgi:hypothetical protein